MQFSEELAWRGLIKDHTFSDTGWLNEPQTFYHGIDCSDNSLTIGNLAAIILAKRFVSSGWKAILLIGGATSLVGDPGGKTEERELKPKQQVEANAKAIKLQVERLFEGQNIEVVNNADWFSEIKFLDFLRDVGKNYSMTELVQRDYIAERMGEGGSGISYAEFSYTLIQGYDYYHLHEQKGAVLQIGGSDQWGNMLSGIPLIRQKVQNEVHVMTMPLVVDQATGRKFGKSEEGAIWLDDQKTTAYQFYQFWLNTADQSVINYLKIFTFLDKEEVEALETEVKNSPAERLAQKKLAFEVTKLVHGIERTESIQKLSETLFGGQSYAQLNETDFKEIKTELPCTKARLGQNTLVDLLVETGLATSNGEARRFLAESAVYINGQQFSSQKLALEQTDVIAGHVILRRGKNSQAVIEIEP